MDPQIEPLTISIDMAARYLNVSRGLAYSMARQKRLPVIRCGKRMLVPKKIFFEDFLSGAWTADKDGGNEK